MLSLQTTDFPESGKNFLFGYLIMARFRKKNTFSFGHQGLEVLNLRIKYFNLRVLTQ